MTLYDKNRKILSHICRTFLTVFSSLFILKSGGSLLFALQALTVSAYSVRLQSCFHVTSLNSGYNADNRFRYIFTAHKDETYGHGIYQNVRILDLKTLQTTYTANLPTANTTLASFDQVTISRTNNVYVTNVPVSGYYISYASTTPKAFSHVTSHTGWKYDSCLAVFNVD